MVVVQSMLWVASSITASWDDTPFYLAPAGYPGDAGELRMRNLVTRALRIGVCKTGNDGGVEKAGS